MNIEQEYQRAWVLVLLQSCAAGVALFIVMFFLKEAFG